MYPSRRTPSASSTTIAAPTCTWASSTNAGVGGRPAPHRDCAGVPSGRRAGVLAARPPAPSHLAPAPAGPDVGRDRALRRAAQAQHHRGHVHARPQRRPGGRLQVDLRRSK
jgi:hypothetical protein